MPQAQSHAAGDIAGAANSDQLLLRRRGSRHQQAAGRAIFYLQDFRQNANRYLMRRFGANVIANRRMQAGNMFCGNAVFPHLA